MNICTCKLLKVLYKHKYLKQSLVLDSSKQIDGLSVFVVNDNVTIDFS